MDLMSNMHVSVVICTRNRAEQLKEALKSWLSVQTRLPWELIVLDNASTDNTRAVIEGAEIPCRYLYGEQIGLGAGRDFAWRQARGKFVLFTDDDCYPAPDLIDAVSEAFEDFPDTGCVGGRIMLHNPDHARVTIKEATLPETLPPHSFIKAGVLHGANMSFPKAVLEDIGGIDSHLGAGTPFPCEDVDAIARVSWAGYDVRYDPRPCVSHDHGRVAADVPALRKSYDRGRGAYYAKFIAQDRTSNAYTKAWARQSSLTNFSTFVREVRSGLNYLLRHGSIVQLLRFSWVSAKIGLRHFVRRLFGKLRMLTKQVTGRV